MTCSYDPLGGPPRGGLWEAAPALPFPGQAPSHWFLIRDFKGPFQPISRFATFHHGEVRESNGISLILFVLGQACFFTPWRGDRFLYTHALVGRSTSVYNSIDVPRRYLGRSVCAPSASDRFRCYRPVRILRTREIMCAFALFCLSAPTVDVPIPTEHPRAGSVSMVHSYIPLWSHQSFSCLI